MTKTEIVEGFCEYLSNDTSIYVTYIRIPILGSIPQAKANGFKCQYSHECGLDLDCPLFKKASNIFDW